MNQSCFSLNEVIELQEKLLNLTNETMEETAIFIFCSGFFENKRKTIQLLDSINCISHSRPKDIEIYMLLLKYFMEDIVKNVKNNDIIEIFGKFNLEILKFFVENLKMNENDFMKYPNLSKLFFIGSKLNNDIKIVKKRPRELIPKNIDLLLQHMKDDNLDGFIDSINCSNIENLNQKLKLPVFNGNIVINNSAEQPTLISIAAFYASTKIFKYLVANKAKINEKTAPFSCAGGNYEIIHALEEYNIDFGDDSINTAIEYHRNDIVQYICEIFDFQLNLRHLFTSIEFYNLPLFLDTVNNVNINSKIGLNGKTALHFAVETNRFDIVEFLSKINGIDFEVTDIHGLTPFNYAIFLGRNKIAYFLFDYSNDLSMLSSLIDKGNMSFLEKLISKFHYRSFKLECIENEKNCINENSQFGSKQKKLQINNNEIKPRIQIHDINMPITKDKDNLLCLACKKGNVKLVNIILSFPECNINYQNNKGETPFIIAAKYNHIEILEILSTQNGIDINIKEKNNGIFFTYLFHCTSYGCIL